MGSVGRHTATPRSKILGGGFVASKRGLLGKKGNQITPLRKEVKKKGGGGGGLDFVIF